MSERRKGIEELVSPAEFPACYSKLRAQVEGIFDPSMPQAIVGIKRGGATLARRLWKDLQQVRPGLEYGEIDIAFYRDDYHLQAGSPRVLGTEITFSVEGTGVILVDDVLFTGRTVRAAMGQLHDFGRPERVWLAVLVDRGHRELPIEPSFTGKTISTQRTDRVRVSFRELGHDADSVDIVRPDNAGPPE